ncbi:MAG: metallophosphoesterase family protein [Patescibacteria group bacterium]
MKIAIFSDLHDDGGNLKLFLDYCKHQKIKNLICCGDLANQESLENLATNFKGKIFMVGGNADLFDESETNIYPNIVFQPKILSFSLGALKIIAIHKPKELREELAKRSEKYDFAFHGHTHRPIISQNEKLITANPGSLNGPDYQASFAILDCATKKIELKILAHTKNP